LKKLSEQYPEAELTAVDISPAMLARTSAHLKNARIICSDMEQYSTTQLQDLIFSNASIQWCDLKSVLRKTYSFLNTDGVFAFSTFGPGTHYQLAKAWQKVDGSEHRIDFLTSDEHIKILGDSGFSIIEHRTSTQRIYFDSAQALLNSIKRTGATNASKNRDRGLLSRDRYLSFLQELNKENPLVLSYETLSFIVRKKEDTNRLPQQRANKSG